MVDGGIAQDVAISARQTTADVYARLEVLSYEELCKHFRQSVKDFFVNRLGRPEILNRIGEDNILVFNFLKDEAHKTAIVEKQIDEVARAVYKRFRVRVTVTPAFKTLLKVHPSGFEKNGARGVRHLLGSLVVDTLAVEVFANQTDLEGKEFKVDYQMREDEIASLPFDKARMEYRWGLA